MNHKQKYKKVIDKLVDKSFPLLKNKKIFIIEIKNSGFSARILKIPFANFIFTSPRLNKYNEEKLMGNFAHELCHLEDYQNNSLKYYLLYAIQGLSKKWRGNYEKQIDRCTIKKGYGKELYEQRSSRYKDKDKNSEKFKPLFLSPKEIKQYAKKINKW